MHGWLVRAYLIDGVSLFISADNSNSFSFLKNASLQLDENMCLGKGCFDEAQQRNESSSNVKRKKRELQECLVSALNEGQIQLSLEVIKKML